jgi:two-component system, OmpR family, response regulator
MMKTQTHHILIVDDDADIAELVAGYLGKHDFRVTQTANPLSVGDLLKSQHVDLIILDVMMPGLDGLSLCREIRQTQTMPIIMLSAANAESDRIVGLELGADDYLVKPFSSRELLARVKAQLRRAEGGFSVRKQALIRFGEWQLDRDHRTLLAKDDLVVPLSQREYALLTYFLDHANRILTRDQLMDGIYGKNAEPFDRAIDVQVGRLRKKIETDAKNPTLITTVRGGGYQFNAEMSACD